MNEFSKNKINHYPSSTSIFFITHYIQYLGTSFINFEYKERHQGHEKKSGCHYVRLNILEYLLKAWGREWGDPGILIFPPKQYWFGSYSWIMVVISKLG